jgi:neurotransmitter:Na+ symporter, NSS family
VIRGLVLQPGQDPGVVQSPLEGLNFVWNPRLDGLYSFNTWLAAAGQIFFTLSVGMGSIHCYASYVKSRQDIALNAASAGWMNEFIEVVLGGSLLIPIGTAYLGLSAVQAATVGGGFGLGFMSLPTLFNNWGWFAPLAGTMWFGLLFFAGITSSLAMGQPILAFLADEFGFSRRRGAIGFGLSVLLLGGFTVWLFPGGAHDEFDYWTGTFSLVVFALLEIVIFAYVFGMEKGWREITRGAELKVPGFFRYVIKYVTPAFILLVFVGALFQPSGTWAEAFRSLLVGNGWPFGAGSVIGKVLHVGQHYVWFEDGMVTSAFVLDLTRLVLLGVFVTCAVLVRRAWQKKKATAAASEESAS